MQKDRAIKKGNNTIILTVTILVLAITNLWTTLYYVPGKPFSTSQPKDEYGLLNPARALFKSEDLIINVQPLRDYLNEKYEKDPNISIYFEYLPTGASIAINKDAEFYPASLLKVPVAIAVAKKIERDDWKWNNKLVLMSADRDEKFGTLYKEPTGSTFTIEELAKRSLTDSDNTAHFILVRNLEVKEIEDVYDHMGLKGFLSTSGNLSAKKYSVIFRTLYNSSYLSEKNSQKLLDYLSQSQFKDYIQSELPQEVPFAHKIGIDRDKNIFLDSGIVYSKDRPFLLTVMIKENDEKTAQKKMKDISKNIYTYVNNYHEESD